MLRGAAVERGIRSNIVRCIVGVGAEVPGERTLQRRVRCVEFVLKRDG